MEQPIHRGELIKVQIHKKGYSVQEVAEALNYGRNSIYRWIEQPNLSMNKVKIIFDFLKLDLNDFFPEEEIGLLVPKKYDEAPNKYVQLLEKYSAAMEEIAEYRRLYGDLPGQKRDN